MDCVGIPSVVGLPRTGYVFSVDPLDAAFDPDQTGHMGERGEVMEDYREDARGHSCLMLGRGAEDRPIHAVCSPRDEYLSIITAYLPDPAEWSSDLRRRMAP